LPYPTPTARGFHHLDGTAVGEQHQIPRYGLLF